MNAETEAKIREIVAGNVARRGQRDAAFRQSRADDAGVKAGVQADWVADESRRALDDAQDSYEKGAVLAMIEIGRLLEML